MTLLQIALLAVIQGAAELLPISSSAHVILAEKWMGLDPSTPEMTFLLVMLHTGTMGSVLLYFWPRWKKWSKHFVKMAILATAVTGVIGLSLKKIIEKWVIPNVLGIHESHAEIEHLFKFLPLIAASLFSVGILIIIAGVREQKASKKGALSKTALSPRMAAVIGLVQGLCLPFRGFSRSGATISAGLLGGIPRNLAEDFSFALAVILTPPVIALEFYRLVRNTGSDLSGIELGSLVWPGLIGMGLSFLTGLLALRWLSSWLEQGKWKYFGFYCIFASLGVLAFHLYG